MSFTSLLSQTISIYPKTGLDKYGRETEDVSVAYRARVQPVTKTRLAPNGETVTIDLVVFLQSSAVVAIDDKATYNSATYKVFRRKEAIDGNGNTHHIELELTKWRT